MSFLFLHSLETTKEALPIYKTFWKGPYRMKMGSTQEKSPLFIAPILPTEESRKLVPKLCTSKWLSFRFGGILNLSHSTGGTMHLNLFLTLLTGTVFLSQLALAQGPCTADREKFCQGVSPGKGRIIRCLKEHASELSQECKDHHEKMREHFHQAKEACHEDVEKFCNAVKPGHGSIVKCLHGNKEKLSSECQQAMHKN
jgi:hypothetical protein